jgi:photosystem II stability/assembly factor-like uncharacterized protein
MGKMNKTPLVVLAFMILLCTSAFSQVYWLDHPSPVNKRLFRAHFVDSAYGWVVGDSGTIINTTNSGATWVAQNSGVVGADFKDLSFSSRTHGWVVSFDSTYRSFLLKTTNSGAVWDKIYFQDTNTILKTVFFLNETTGFVSGFSGYIYKTTNAGINWSNCYIDTTSCLYLFPKDDIVFVNALTGYACGGVLDLQGIFVKTTNGGASWYSMCVAAEPLHEIRDLGNGRIAIMGGDYDLGSILAVSSNSGANWIYEQTGCFGNAEGFAFRTPSEVWAALNFAGRFAVNLDSMKPGSRWECIDSPGQVEVNDVEFLNPQLGFAFGEKGKIFKYNPAIIGINNTGNNIPLENELLQNYPNPFNPETMIEYLIASPSDVVISIFDNTGKEVRSFNEGFKGTGKHNISVNFSDLPSGVYFYRLNAGEVSLSRKMVLIK